MPQDASSLTDRMVLETPLTDTNETARQLSLDDSQDAFQPLDSMQNASVSKSISEVTASDDIEPTRSESLRNPHAFVEAVADELMHEVFDDVDRMLDKGVVVSPAQPHAVNITKRQFSVTSLNSGGALAPLDASRINDSEPTVLEPQSDYKHHHAEPTAHIIKPREFWVRLSLIVTASIGVGIGLAFWMAQRNEAQLASSPSSAIEASSSTTGAETNSFSDYVLNSLEAIDRRYELLARSGENPELVSDDVEAIADGLNTTGLGTEDSPQVVERVYIPVYQPQQSPGSVPTIASAPLNQVTTATPTEGNASASAPIQNIAPNTTHKLVGTLELGDRSAAIFEYAGSAHRLEIGQQIGASGWSLVSVSGQEAIIRRNGEVRSIYMQQSF